MNNAAKPSRTSGMALALLLLISACGKAPENAPATDTVRFSIMSTENAQAAQKSWAPFLADMEKATGLKVQPFFGSN